MRSEKWTQRVLVLAGTLGSFGCGGQARAVFGGRNVAQATSTMIDAPARAESDRRATFAVSTPACVGVSDQELTASPLENRRIFAVTPVREPFPPKGHPARLLGATVYMLASPGLTKEWLGHLIECHIARGGRNSPATDPLGVGLPAIDVISTSNGFGVSITSKDPYEAERILQLGERLAN